MAAASETKYSIMKLNGNNYFNWRYKIEMMIKEKGAWDAIKNPKPQDVTVEWIKMDEKAHSTIALTVEDDQIQHIRNCTTAKDAWMALKEFHEKDSPSNRVHILRMIMRQRLEEGGNVEAHANTMNELFQKLMALGGEIKPEFFMSATLMGSLPESYDSLITALEARSEEELTSNLVRQKIIAEYRRRTERGFTSKEAVVLKVLSKSDKKCFFCKEMGHIRKYCEKYKKWKHSKGNWKQQKINIVNNDDDSEGEFLFVSKTVSGWILDSGATCHIVGNKENFIEFDQEYREKVCTANGEEMMAIGKGTVQINFLNESNERSIVKMADVLYIPGIGNLISVRRLAEKGLKINFFDQQCEIRTSDGAKQIAIGDVHGKLYKLREPNKVYLSTEPNKVYLSPEHLCVHRWHEILGHRDVNVVKTLASSGLVEGVQIAECEAKCKEKLNCAVCLEGKITRIKFPKESKNRARAVLDMIHTDVCGPMQTMTPSGKKYILTFVDDYSRFTTIYLLKNKYEVFDKFKEFNEMSKNMFGRKVKFIRSDRGGEYTGKEFNDYMAKEGIQYQRTAPYTPQQNGVAERKNRTLIEMARCMLLESGLDKKFWGEAVSMVNFIQNRLPVKEILKTPHEHWYGIKPYIGHFKQFGSKCYIHVPDEARRKLDPKGVQGILVGYDINSKAYRCYIQSTGKIVISRDVKFVEKENNWKLNKNTLKSEINNDEKSIGKERRQMEKEMEININDIIYDQISNAQDVQENQDCEVISHENKNNHDNDSDIIVNNEANVGVKRSSRISIPPKRLIEEINMVFQEPRSYDEAMSSVQKDKWIIAMQDEIESMKENKTWNLVELPSDRKAIGCKWIFKIKMDSSGKISRYKARLVAQGFSQKFGIDYDIPRWLKMNFLIQVLSVDFVKNLQ